jgi:serine protease Do
MSIRIPARSAMLATLLMLLLSSPANGGAEQTAGADRSADLARRRSPVVEVFQRCRNAVVNISSTEIVTVRSRSPFDSMFDEFFDMPSRPRQYERTSVGSGFVIHPDGYIVTNAHVVARTAEQRITFADGSEYDARIVAIDTNRDLAVLRIEADRPLPTLTLGRSDDLLVGETVIAIGNPLGLENTVTAGVVSAVGREVAINRELRFKGLIQTDASINPGNSGGPLLNVLGELIGINSAIRGDAQNIGFAIPVDHLREVLPDLLDVERRYRIVTGMAVDTLDEPRVKLVKEDSPAERAGVRVGDVLKRIDGRPVREGIDFDIALINRKAGETLLLDLKRGEKTIQTALRLQQRPKPDGRELAESRLGVEVVPLSEEVAEALDLPSSRGLVIGEIEPGGPGDRAGVARRDILLALGRHYVSTLDDLGQILEALEPDETVEVRVLRIERRGRDRVKVQLRGPVEVR